LSGGPSIWQSKKIADLTTIPSNGSQKNERFYKVGLKKDKKNTASQKKSVGGIDF